MNGNNWSSGFCGKFLCKVTWSECFKSFINAQLPLNENENNCGVKLYGIYYNRTVSNLHDTCCKNYFLILMMFLCLVMDMVCLIILNFIIKIYRSIKYYQVHIWGILRVKMEKIDKRTMGVRLKSLIRNIFLGVYWKKDNIEIFFNIETKHYIAEWGGNVLLQ